MDINTHTIGVSWFQRFLTWYGYCLGDPFVQLWGCQLVTSLKTRFIQKVLNFVSNIYYINSHNMNHSTFLDYYSNIKCMKLKVFYGYVSSILNFAEYLEALDLIPLEVGSVVTTAETLLHHQRNKIEMKFQTPVYSQYGCDEINGLASECETHSGFHISSEHVYLEVLKDNSPVGKGESGEVVLTDLDAYQMPLIRYKLGDVAHFGDKYNCRKELPLLEKIEGRTSDIIVGPSGNSVHGEFFSHLVESTGFMDNVGLKQFQVVQKTTHRMDFKMICLKKPSVKQLEALSNFICNYLGDIRINYEIVDIIRPHPSGKLRFTISEI